MKDVWISLLFLVVLASCVAAPKAQLDEVKAMPHLAWEKVPGSAAWTKHVMRELEKSAMLDVVPADAEAYCGNFKKLSRQERAEFYAQLISIMSKRESGWKTDTKFKEDFKDAKGRYVISRGLMQISIESANSYGCGFSNAEELHDPLRNLSCSIKIIDRWVSRDKRLGGKIDGKWRGVARYWSVGRDVSRSFPVVRDYVRALPICK